MYQLKIRSTDNYSLLARIVIMDQRLQNENDENKIAEREKARAGMVAAYRGRITQEPTQC